MLASYPIVAQLTAAVRQTSIMAREMPNMVNRRSLRSQIDALLLLILLLSSSSLDRGTRCGFAMKTEER
jgi:hypothetical protein